MSEKKDKQAQAWQLWTGTLTASARAALQHKEPSKLPVETAQKPDDEDADAYGRFRASLSESAREWLDKGVDTEPAAEEEIDTTVARYGLVECPDGEWASMRLFKTVEGLARRVGQLEGDDVVLWAFFGLPIQITKGPQRYLIMPGGQTGIMVPMYDGGPVKKVPGDLLDTLEIQDDGFVGPPELANTKVVEEKLAKTAKAKQDDDEDDEDEDEEAGV